jgi:capsid portal protein
MSKRRNRTRTQPVQQEQMTGGPAAEAFTFGDPVPVLDRRELLDYVECVVMDKWYEPPVSFDGLARTFRAAVHHSSPINVKRNILTSTFIPHPSSAAEPAGVQPFCAGLSCVRQRISREAHQQAQRRAVS